jgi:hypothetical protein
LRDIPFPGWLKNLCPSVLIFFQDHSFIKSPYYSCKSLVMSTNKK